MTTVVEVKDLISMRMLDSGLEIEVAEKNGHPAKLTFDDKDLMHLVEYICLASYSLTTSRKGNIAALQLVDAMTHQIADGQIAIEIAFGEKGGTFLACPHPVARKLVSEIQKRLPPDNSAASSH